MDLRQDVQHHDLERTIGELTAETGDARHAVEALRLVGLTIQDLVRSHGGWGGGPQPQQAEALVYLIQTVQQHVERAHDAAERVEAATADSGDQGD